MTTPELTVLSFGGGQDSAALLHLYLNEPDFRVTYGGRRLIVVMAATGNEHPDTDEYVVNVAELCRKRGIPFFHITGDMGYHTGHWKNGLLGQFAATNTIGSVSYPKSCTSSLKIEPIWKFVEAWISREYGFPSKRGKTAIKAFVRQYGKIRCVIGFAKGEEGRAAPATPAAPAPTQSAFDFGKLVDLTAYRKKKRQAGPRNKWFAECISTVFPLIELGMDRAACQTYVRNLGEIVPPPSNCIACPFKSAKEVLLTSRVLPEMFALWVELERRKLAAWEGRVDDDGRPIPNHGVKGKKTLPEFLEEAKRKYGHLTTEELEEDRFSHGHCVTSKYAAA